MFVLHVCKGRGREHWECCWLQLPVLGRRLWSSMLKWLLSKEDMNGIHRLQALFLKIFSFCYQCNRVPDERRYLLPLKSNYMRQIDRMVGLIWMVLQSNFCRVSGRAWDLALGIPLQLHSCVCCQWVSLCLLVFDDGYEGRFNSLTSSVFWTMEAPCATQKEISRFKTSNEKCWKWRLDILQKRKKEKKIGMCHLATSL